MTRCLRLTDLTLEKKTGARGLRSIIEKTLLPIMYDIPSDSDVKKVVITKECVLNGEKPLTETAKTSVKGKNSELKLLPDLKMLVECMTGCFCSRPFFVLAASLLFTAKIKLPL